MKTELMGEIEWKWKKNRENESTDTDKDWEITCTTQVEISATKIESEKKHRSSFCQKFEWKNEKFCVQKNICSGKRGKREEGSEKETLREDEKCMFKIQCNQSCS